MARLHRAVLLACIAALAARTESASVTDKEDGKEISEKQLEGSGNKRIPPVPSGVENLPDEFIPCAYEGDTCLCDGYVIIGDPDLNQWSELAESKNSLKCLERSFSQTVDSKKERQCWCKPRALANRDDLGNALPLLPPAAFQQIADGLIWWAVTQYSLFNSMQSWDVLAVDTTKRKIDIAYNQDGNLPTPELARRWGALAAVNGGFHAYGSSLGGITELRVAGVDIVKEDSVTQWDLTKEDVEGVIGVDKDGKVDIFTTADVRGWTNEPTFMHSGPLLLYKGVRQPLDDKTWNHVRNPRTSVCTVNEHTALMVTVDGRYHTSSGMTLGELQLFLKALGCQSAINLDGGGSTTMYIRSMEGVVANGVVNEPRNKPPPGVPGFHDFLTLRNVSNAVIVL